MVNVKPVKLGNTERMSFGKIEEVIDMPNLIEVQKESYNWFLNEGLEEVFKDVSGITDYQDNLVLDFIDYTLDIEHPNYSVIECKVRDATYSAALRVTARLLNKSTGEIKESNVFMGDFPLMTPSGTFVINGAERVIVSQLVRSPGRYPQPRRVARVRNRYQRCFLCPHRQKQKASRYIIHQSARLGHRRRNPRLLRRRRENEGDYRKGSGSQC